MHPGQHQPAERRAERRGPEAELAQADGRVEPAGEQQRGGDEREVLRVGPRDRHARRDVVARPVDVDPRELRANAITPTATTAASSVISIPANGDHSGQRGSASPAGAGSGRSTPSGSSGRGGGDPGCWKEGGGTLMRGGGQM